MEKLGFAIVGVIAGILYLLSVSPTQADTRGDSSRSDAAMPCQCAGADEDPQALLPELARWLTCGSGASNAD